MGFYRKKPITIEAQELTNYSFQEIVKWCDGKIVPEGIIIKTLEGDHLARWGDYVIKGVQGEFYPCKPDIFEKTYEAAPYIDRDSASRIAMDHAGERP